MTMLLVIIYIAFISLGLPDAIMGSAWPVLHMDLNVPVAYAGIFSTIVSGGTIISSLSCERLLARFGTGKLTVASVLATALGLIGVFFAPSYIWLILLAIPLGLGAGAVDSALNNFVALHYRASHMNWLHCFWGIGASAGPLLMSSFLLKENGWRQGYLMIGTLQILLVICLIGTLPLWKKVEGGALSAQQHETLSTKIPELLKLRGAKPALISFFCYCAIEATTGLWGSSYLVYSKAIMPKQAAEWIALYYVGITCGRMLTGFISMRVQSRVLIRLGQITAMCGAAALLVPISAYTQLAGFILIGLGLAPIYPAMLHETPNRFGKERSAGIMGIQMATAYVGTTLMPPLFGFIAGKMGFTTMPFFLLALLLLMLVTSEQVRPQKVTI